MEPLELRVERGCYVQYRFETRAGVDYLIFVSIARATKLGMFNYHCTQLMSFRQIADAIMKSHGKAVVSQLKDLT